MRVEKERTQSEQSIAEVMETKYRDMSETMRSESRAGGGQSHSFCFLRVMGGWGGCLSTSHSGRCNRAIKNIDGNKSFRPIRIMNLD